MIHKFKVEPMGDSYKYAKVSIDGNAVLCQGYTLKHYVDSIPTVEIDLCAFPQVEHDVVIQVGNKEEIARLMNYSEFQEFCRIWEEVHDEGNN